jgi:hypothetical protein
MSIELYLNTMEELITPIYSKFYIQIITLLIMRQQCGSIHYHGLATSACSTDVERLFSHSGDVCSPDRNSLSGRSVNILTILTSSTEKSLDMYCR